MEYILFCYMWTVLSHVSRNETVLRFEVTLNTKKQGLREHIHLKGKKRGKFNNLCLLTEEVVFVKKN